MAVQRVQTAIGADHGRSWMELEVEERGTWGREVIVGDSRITRKLRGRVCRGECCRERSASDGVGCG